MPQESIVIRIKIFIMTMLKLPSQICKFIKRNIKIFLNKIKTKKRTEPHIILVGTPEYGNLGDQIIALAEIEWLKKYYFGYKIKEFTHETLIRDKNCRMLLSQINKNDFIFLQGGGNLNDLYLNCEGIRRKVISSCPENKIILFQQSIFFSDTEKGNEVKEKTRAIYNAHKKFTIITRENKSYETAKEIFEDLKVLLFPDMATYLFDKIKPEKNIERSGIITCLRDDDEKFYSDDELENLMVEIEHNHFVSRADTNVKRNVTPDNRYKEIEHLLRKISSHKVMLTDRFHGVVFSIFAKTPCVVLRSSDHKIVEGVKWFKDVEGIFYAENLEEVPSLVEKALSVGEVETPDFTHYFDELYELVFDNLN